MQKILNLGCGPKPFKNTSDKIYTNVDMINNPNIIKHNLTKSPYPFADKEFDRIYLFHAIEHIPEEKHVIILREIRRLLKPEGKAIISYPEFKKCAQNYIENKNDKEDFWKMTIFGRGTTEYDRHKALMDSEKFILTLKIAGLDLVRLYPEVNENYNTVVIAKRGDFILTYEELMRKECAANP